MRTQDVVERYLEDLALGGALVRQPGGVQEEVGEGDEGVDALAVEVGQVECVRRRQHDIVDGLRGGIGVSGRRPAVVLRLQACGGEQRRVRERPGLLGERDGVRGARNGTAGTNGLAGADPVGESGLRSN